MTLEARIYDGLEVRGESGDGLASATLLVPLVTDFIIKSHRPATNTIRHELNEVQQLPIIIGRTANNWNLRRVYKVHLSM